MFTVGPWARRPFVLEAWQEHEIIRPLFGEVIWSTEFGEPRYVRRYRIAYIVMARKNGKSELAAAIALYLLRGDGEDAAHIYGAAKDTKQAAKVWDPARRMVKFSPWLSSQLGINKNSKRIYHDDSDSYYEIIVADADGELGHNPHGFILDEVLSQRDGKFWDTMRTGTGSRTQPLALLITTETNDPSSFGADMIDEAERIQKDPSRAPHAFTFVRKTPNDADPWDEKNWHYANPALGTFLSIEALRIDALEARNDPTKEASFRQFRLNQRQNASTRWFASHLWAQGAQLPATLDKVAGRQAWGGLDLSATDDLTCLAWIFPDRYPAGRIDVLWRFWTNEGAVAKLDKATAGKFSQWIKQGLVEVTEGDVIDYEPVWKQIEDDARLFPVQMIGVDRWNSQATLNWCQANGIQSERLTQGYPLSPAMKEIERLLKDNALNHGGNQVASWCADCAEVKRRSDDEAIKLMKPDRASTSKRVDAIASLSMAIDRWAFGIVEDDVDLATQVY